MTTPSTQPPNEPWYTRTLRWGQTNITERDPIRYDIDWWRDFWRRTYVQGVIINAGGIVAYYPSRFPLHYRAQYLGARDLFGDLTAAAKADGLVVLARMDSNRTTEDFFQAHPDWFARDQDGNPYRAGDRYVTCIHSPYYDEYLPGVLREIAERYHIEGFTDNSWSGLGRDQICYCEHCTRQFHAATGSDLPPAVNWDDPVYRAWIRWSYDRRLAVWDLNNETTQAAGGPDCLWLGMNSANIHHQSMRLRDFKRICERSPILMLDHQRRSAEGGFQENGNAGKLSHGLLGWDKLMPESMAQYQAGTPTFRVASKPAAEARYVDVRGFCRRHPTLVALHQRLSRRSPPISHGAADHGLAHGQRAISGQPPAHCHGRRGLVARQCGFLRPGPGPRPGDVALSGHDSSLDPGAYPLSAGAWRSHRKRWGRLEHPRPAQPGRDVRRTNTERARFCGPGRQFGGLRRNQPLHHGWRAPSGLRLGRSAWRTACR